MISQVISPTGQPTHWTVLISLALIAIIPGTIAAIFSIRGHKAAKETNDAVNHQHTKPDGTPRLYDAVLALYEWKDRWDSLPPDLATGQALSAKFSEIDRRINEGFSRNEQQHNEIIQMIDPTAKEKA